MSTVTLVGTAVGSVLLLLFPVMKARMHAFVALMLVSIAAGIFSGMPLDHIADTMQKAWATRWASRRSWWRWGNVRQDPA